MSIQLKKIVDNIDILKNLYTKDGLSIKMSYAIAKNISKIEKEMVYYYNERDKLLEKYAEKDENNMIKLDGQNVVIPPENVYEWNVKIMELMTIEVNIDFHKFPLEELYTSKCSLTPAEIVAIDYMIEEETLDK